MLELSKMQIEHLIRTDGRRRYEFSVKKIVDWECAWGLSNSAGWMMTEDDDGNEIFPLWPAKVFAELCNVDAELKFEAKAIELDGLMEELLQNLMEKEILVALFNVPESIDVPVVKAADFLRDLDAECSKY